MKRLIYILALALISGNACAYGQDETPAPADSTAVEAVLPTIADKINAGGRARVIQPEKLNRRPQPDRTHRQAAESHAATGGYRIQAFSGNNARTAKRDAEGRAAAIAERYPEHATYVTFDAPYWRLRVGDFRSYEEASAALSDFKHAFPSFAREMRLVRDRINIRD